MIEALIVDDSRALRGILGKMLSRHGFTVFQAENGKQALKSLEGEARAAKLVCLDYNMPEMNGLEFLTCMRQMPEFKDLPVLMITTETHLEFVSKAIAAGSNEYVMKPFTEDMVVDKLRMLGFLPEEPS
jgi:two-component system chemotaxis response regulator CheY